MVNNFIEDTLMKLLDSIYNGDYTTYSKLVSKELTCFEPETKNHLISGLEFHKFLIENIKPAEKYNLQLANPVVKIYDRFAYTAYTLISTIIIDDQPVIKSVNETRIFQKIDDNWKMIHFHRS